MKKVVLKEIIQYQNDSVIHKFLESFSVSYEEAENIFNETKKMLYCSHDLNMQKKAGKVDFTFTVYDPILILDEMWHTFILFTKDYTGFCENYFGYYLHHAPTDYKEKEKFLADFSNNKEEVLNETRKDWEKQLSYIYDTLGKDTTIKWYETYPIKYSPEIIHTLRRK